VVVELLLLHNNNRIADRHNPTRIASGGGLWLLQQAVVADYVVPTRIASGGSLRQSAADVLGTSGLDGKNPFRFLWSHERARQT
jgi:hypothetical protein